MEDDIELDTEESSLDEAEARCPRTGEEVIYSGKAYTFAGFPHLICWKIRSEREITALEYQEALEAYLKGEKPPILDGFTGQNGKSFSAGLIPVEKEDDGHVQEEGQWGFYFPEPELSDKLCPKSGSPVIIYPKTYKFPGYPDVRFYREICEREMSVDDFINIINAGESGFFLRGFKSKKKERFDAKLILCGEKIQFLKK